MSLDPPIRKGQTYYTHVLTQFASEEDSTVELDIAPEALAAKNESVSEGGAGGGKEGKEGEGRACVRGVPGGWLARWCARMCCWAACMEARRWRVRCGCGGALARPRLP